MCLFASISTSLRKLRSVRGAIFIGASLVSGSLETLACDQISVSNSNYNLANNPQPTLDFTVKRNNGNTTCRWYIAIDKGAHNNGTYNRYLQNSPAQLPVQIYDASGSVILMAPPDAVPPNNVLSGSFSSTGGGNTQTAQYRIVLGTVPFSTPTGTYQNTWQVALYRANLASGSYSVANNTNIGAQYNVQPSVDVSLTDTGQPFNMWDTEQTLDFGEIQQNQEMSFDMRIGANRPFRYQISSTNAGYLRRQGTNSNTQNNIKYRALIGATAYSSAVTIDTFPYTSPNLSPPTGTQLVFPFTVRIMDAPVSKFAGTFTDTVTITITAL